MDLKELPDGISFKVKVQPKASKNEICGLIGDALKLRLTAPPVEGAANQSIIEFFSKLFRIPKSNVEILSGHTGRNKVIKVIGVTTDQANKIFGL